MKSIDELICDELVGRRRVVLPMTGALEVERRGAKQISDTRIAPPKNVVVFSLVEAEGPETIISLLAADRNIPLDEAVAEYGSWIESASRPDGSLVIDGVGEVREGSFNIDPGLHAALNPEGEEPVTMQTRKRGVPAWVWIAIAILAALGVLCGLRYCKPGIFGGRSKAPVTETTAAPIQKSAADSLAAANAASAATTTPASSTAGRFHVVAGAFAIESNADKFVAKLKREHPELTPVKLPHPRAGYNMVSIWQAPTEREARSKMNLYWDVNSDLWIYEQK
jgi:hypothetical protein